MQTILSQQNDGDAVKVINDVMQRFVAMSASFVSCIASTYFKSLCLKNKEEMNKLIEKQQKEKIQRILH